MKILVTGGCGFIGLHTVKKLIARGHQVSIMDNFDKQAHPAFSMEISLQELLTVADVRNRDMVSRLIEENDAILHLASAVGVGQSMYDIDYYVDNNTRGTAILLEELVRSKKKPGKFVVASSMSMYGEGYYGCKNCHTGIAPQLRTAEQMKSKHWEQICPKCGRDLASQGTPEIKSLEPTSIYAMTKRHQEEMSLLIGKTYGFPTVAVRYFNVYGPGQSLSNPYTGVAAIFMSRIMSGNSPYIFEDGLQSRDFIYVDDVAEANCMALESKTDRNLVLNIGTGRPTTILDVAKALIKECKSSVRPVISNEYRKGDIRHCYADMSNTEKTLGFRAKTSFSQGIAALVDWARSEKKVEDNFDKALNELKSRQLV